jgi:hypothetical protein
MKLLSFTILSIITFSSYSVEFHRCTDDKGKTHYTNLPISSLDFNCVAKDHYTLLLEQDYQNLPNKFNQYEVKLEENLEDSSIAFDIDKDNLSPDSIKNKVNDIFDPDKALEELMEATEDRDDAFTRAMRGRSEGIENIVNQGKSDTP